MPMFCSSQRYRDFRTGKFTICSCNLLFRQTKTGGGEEMNIADVT